MIRTASFALLVLALLTSASVFAADKKGGSARTLVMYYSLTGNTKAAARAVAEQLNADIVRIEDVEPPLLTSLYDEKMFADMKKKPWKLKPVNADLARYDRIFIGAPIWRGHETPAIDAFFDQTDLTDKSVILFVTMMENDPDDAIKAMTLKVIERGGKVVSSFSINTYGQNNDAIAAKAKEIAKKY